jgi:hypothetical protein
MKKQYSRAVIHVNRAGVDGDALQALKDVCGVGAEQVVIDDPHKDPSLASSLLLEHSYKNTLTKLEMMGLRRDLMGLIPEDAE